MDPLLLTTTSHDLRHHFASVLIAAGESVIAVAEWLGHENASLVFNTYGHLMPHSEDRMRRAIDAAYGVGVNSCAPGVPQRSAIKPLPAQTAAVVESYMFSHTGADDVPDAS